MNADVFFGIIACVVVAAVVALPFYWTKCLKLVQTNGDVRIVILQRAWVVVGRFTQNGSQCTLENASVIRNWGTERGLGQIATDGPTSKTILDKCPTVRFHELSAVASIDCVVDKWSKHV